MTNDCDYPFKLESQLLTQLWKCMLQESLREMGYMAELAGTQLNLTVNNEYIKLNYFAFNDNIETYLVEVFGQLQKFETDEEFFNNLKQSRLRNMKNSLFSEPYQMLG